MRSTFARTGLLALAAWTTAVGSMPSRPSASPRAAAEELLAKSMAAYAALTSYADSGTVIEQYDETRSVGHVRTYYRKQPKSFYFEWGRRVYFGTKSASDSLPLPGKQLVFWLVNGDLHKYDREGATHNTYPAGTSNQPAALASAKATTMETITLIPSLLFQKANLVGPLQEVAEISTAGTEDVDGHRCHKLVGIARSVYPSGAITNVRPITVWIDAQTLLVRKVFTDTPKSYGMNSIHRFTYTLDPIPNSALDDSKLQFTVPSMQQ